MKIIYLFTLILFIPYSFKGQYVNYSQFYSSPLNLNPAMTGVGEYGRIGFIYRNQWPSINQGYHYISSWADYNLSQNNFSIGLSFSNETENVSNLSTTHISPSLAYEINLSYKWILKSGIQMSYTNSNFNNQNLIFYDQFGSNGVINPTAENIINFQNKNYINLAIGILSYSKKTWLGVSIFNISEPDISFSGDTYKLERLYSFHGGYNFENIGLSPSFHFKKISSFKQLDIGTYIKMTPLSIGIWYRGIPINDNNNLESLIGSLNLNAGNFNVSYSYDYNLSELSGSSGGSHEISIIYEFNFLGKKLPPKNVRFLECPVPNF